MESLLTDDQRKLRDEVRDFVKSVPRQLLLDMDAGVAPYPKQFLEEAGRRNLLGLRFPQKYGGRGLGWREDDDRPGGDRRPQHQPAVSLQPREHRRRGAHPLRHAGAERALAAPRPRRGTRRRRGPHRAPWRLRLLRRHHHAPVATAIACCSTAQKRFIVGAEGADYFFAYAKTHLGGRSPARVHQRPSSLSAAPASKCSTSTASWARAAAAPAASTSATPASPPKTSSGRRTAAPPSSTR